MRFLPLLLASLLLAPATLAQGYATDKGSYLLDGAVAFTSQGGDLVNSEDNGRVTTILLSPAFAYFVAPGLAIGGAIQFHRASRDDVSNTTTALGPSVSYFFGGADTRTFPFVSATAGYSRQSFDSGDFSRSTDGYQFGFEGGLSHLISRNVALTGALFYLNHTISEDDNSTGSNTFGVQGGVTAFIF